MREASRKASMFERECSLDRNLSFEKGVVHEYASSLTVNDLLASQCIIQSTGPDKVIACKPNDSVYVAERKLKEAKIGLLVVQDRNSVVGVISERDFMMKVAEWYHDPDTKKMKVKDIMTPTPYSCTRDTTLDQCVNLVVDHGIRHLPIMEPIRSLSDPNSMRITGVLSTTDILRKLHALTRSGMSEQNERLKNRMRKIKVADVLCHENISKVHRIAQESKVRDAIIMMKRFKIGSIVVTKSIYDHHVVGIFTERDLLLRVLDENDVKLSDPIHKVMTPNPYVVNKSDSLAAACDLMMKRMVRHTPVVDAKGNCIGLISIRNVIKHAFTTEMN